MPSFTLSQLAQRLEVELQGPADLLIEGVCSLEEPRPNSIGFAETPRQVQSLSTELFTALIVPPATNPGVPHLVCPKPRVIFAKALRLFYPPRPLRPGVHPTAHVSTQAWVSPSAEIGPFCVVGALSRVEDGTHLVARVVLGSGVSVGPDCQVLPGVFIGDRAQVGPRCVLDAQCRLTADTIVGADVHVGVRTVLEGCQVGQGTKTDNLVHIGQGSVIGPHSLFVSKSCVGRRVKTGPYFLLAAVSCVEDDVTLGPLTQVAGFSRVDRSWEGAKLQLAGEPAQLLQCEVKQRAESLRAAKTYRRLLEERKNR